MSVATQAPPKTRKPRPHQFTLWTLLVAVAVAAFFLAYRANVRPATLAVRYEAALIDKGELEPLLTSHEAIQVKESPYSWILVDDAEWESLRNAKKSSIVSFVRSDRTVHDWPRQAETSTGQVDKLLKPEFAPGHFQEVVNWETSACNGFLGSRLYFRQIQLRVQLNFRTESPVELSEGVAVDDARRLYDSEEVQGAIFYEGKAPDGRLLFFAPLGRNRYHFVVFDTELVKAGP
jgi:hypothetical protein